MGSMMFPFCLLLLFKSHDHPFFALGVHLTILPPQSFVIVIDVEGSGDGVSEWFKA